MQSYSDTLKDIMRIRQPKPENTVYFTRYKEKGLFLTLARQYSTNFISALSKEAAEELLNKLVLPQAIYEDSIVALSDVMTVDGLTKLRTQFRQFKARTKSGIKHLALREETYNKILFLAKDFDNIDQLFEHLFSPDAGVEMFGQLKLLEEAGLPSALENEKVNWFHRVKSIKKISNWRSAQVLI